MSEIEDSKPKEKHDWSNLPIDPVGNDSKLTQEEMLERVDALLCIAETFGFEDKVWRMGIDGSCPFIYVVLGLKENNPNALIVKKIYEGYNLNGKKCYWAEGWNP